MDACEPCAAGTRQPEPNATACVACEVGSYCTEGASAPLPCPVGTFTSATDAGSVGDCAPCPKGSFCPLGSAAALLCAAGSYSGSENAGRCDLCPSGSYMNATGATACMACRTGSFCPDGATMELPANCPPGTLASQMPLARTTSLLITITIT